MTGRGFRFTRENAPAYPLTGNAANRQALGNDIERYSPARGPGDLRAGNDIERRLQRSGIVDIAQIIDELTAHNTPPQLVQAGFSGLITGLGIANAVLLIPKNPNRQSVKIANPTANGNITFSYDAPNMMGGVGMGIPVPAGSYDEEANGSVSINSIYVWSDFVTATFPIPVIGYEGVLSVVGNRR